LRWFGHVKRVYNTGCQLKCCIATSRTKGIEAVNQKAWIDKIKEDLKARNVDIRAAVEMTRDRAKCNRYNFIVSKPGGRETTR